MGYSGFGGFLNAYAMGWPVIEESSSRQQPRWGQAGMSRIDAIFCYRMANTY